MLTHMSECELRCMRGPDPDRPSDCRGRTRHADSARGAGPAEVWPGSSLMMGPDPMRTARSQPGVASKRSMTGRATEQRY